MTAINTAADRLKEMGGLELLLYGWVGVPKLQFGWLANPLLLVALGLLAAGAYRKALRVGTAACVLGLSSLTWYAVPIPVSFGGANSDLQLFHPSIGFFFWMASLLVAPVTAHLLSQRETGSKPQVSSPSEPNV
ncbi:hypothetical protein [Corallococcus carmarthensis]|nr:hypothetical protein [Corallococcus carmarthensis]